MAKRHVIRAGDLESVFGRMQELVLANSGEDEFEEIFKLLVAKLLNEERAPGSTAFKQHASPEETSRAVNALLWEASRRWPGVLPQPPTSRLTDEHLSVCVQALQGVSLRDGSLEVLDGAFEYLVSRVAKSAKGQFFTPRHVIDCCIRMIDPNPTETVLDPACGSAGFLIHAMNHVAERGTFDRSSYSELQLWGFDFDHRAIRVAKTLMLMAGDGRANLFRANSLLTPAANQTLFTNGGTDEGTPWLTIEDVVRARVRGFRGFDIVVTNPPFAGEVREQHILQTYGLYRRGRRVERDVLFLERIVDLLRPGGRFAVVLPHNKFGGVNWAYVREWLVRHVRVVAVLGLGRHTFLPHTHQKASVLFGVKRARPVQRLESEEILFLISERDGKDSRGQVIPRIGSSPEDPAWSRADHDLGDIVTMFHDFVAASNIPWRNDDGTQ